MPVYFKSPQMIPVCNQIERTTALNPRVWLEAGYGRGGKEQIAKRFLAQLLKCCNLAHIY